MCDLDAPINTVTNAMSFGALMDCSSPIGTGTFRVGFTVNTDDSTGTRRALPDLIGQCPFFSIKICSLKKCESEYSNQDMDCQEVITIECHRKAHRH